MLESLRSGDWLTPERVRLYPRILLAMFALIALAAIAFPKVIGPKDLPLGTDFSQVWITGKEVLAGAPDAPYDLTRHIDAQRAVFGANRAQPASKRYRAFSRPSGCSAAGSTPLIYARASSSLACWRRSSGCFSRGRIGGWQRLL